MLAASVAIAQTAPPQNKKAEAPPQRESRRAVAVETRQQLFATLCALDAAGFDSSVVATNQSAGRAQLRERMRALQGPAVEALRKYYQEHALADPGVTFSRFVSFALAAGPPPKFTFEMRREDLPPDALALESFNEVLANFYRESQLDQLWQHYQPDYERGVEFYSAPLSEVAFTATSYLREILKSNSPRTFSLYVEPLAGRKTNFRNYGDHYELVVGPIADPPMDDIRHAFLHFILDPMAIRYRTQAARAAPLLEYAAHAPLLPVEFHDDFSAFFDECLVRAVELRLRHLSPANLASAIDQAESSGFVMVRPIYAGLSGFEKSEPAMSYYLPDLIKGIDVAGESRRLRGVKFAEAAPAGQAPEKHGAAVAKRIDHSVRGASGTYQHKREADGAGHHHRRDAGLVAGRDDHVLDGAAGWASAAAALWPVCSGIAGKNRRGGALGGAFRFDGRVHLAAAAGGAAFDRHTRGGGADGL